MNPVMKRRALIYFSAYSTHSDFTLDEWFEAREYFKHNKKAIAHLLAAK